MFNSVLRRYTPPTCTLEIRAKGSPLSQWTDRLVLRQLQFQLSFDDPKLPIDQQVRIQGDRVQLESLGAAVSSYVQTFLMQSSIDLEAIGWGATQTGENSALAMALRGSRTDLQPGSLQPGSLLPGLDADPHQFKLSARAVEGDSLLPTVTTGIALKPRGLLSHDLVLGSLATAESGSVICLSAIQLFDLANALDEYAAEVLTLPALTRPWFRSQQGMLSIAAATLLSLGVTASLLKFVVEMNAPIQTATSPAAPEAGLPNSQVTTVPNSPQISGTKSPSSFNFAPPNPLRLPRPPAAVSGSPATANQPVPPSLPPQLPPIAVAPLSRAAQTQIPIQPVDPENPPALATTDAQSSREAQVRVEQNRADQSREASGAELAAPGADTDSTAFDTIPQVAEARAYFQQRWQPPTGLTQTLEYRLRVSADGTIQQIMPLGQAAGDYVDRTPIPLIGEPFVSPLQANPTAEIRLVLSPNGRVRTFLEAPN